MQTLDYVSGLHNCLVFSQPRVLTVHCGEKSNVTFWLILQLLEKHEIEGSGGGGPDIYHNEGGSGTPNYVDDPENEGLFRAGSRQLC